MAEALLRPRVRQLTRRVAARVALVGPELAIEAIVLRRVEIDRQRRDAGRRRRGCAAAGCAAPSSKANVASKREEMVVARSVISESPLVNESSGR